jgi:hypothetical protein
VKNWIFKDGASPTDPKTAHKRAVLLSLPFAIVGVLALIFLVHDEIGSGFRMERRLAMGLLSAAVVCAGLIALIFGVNAKKTALKTAGLKSPAPQTSQKPWLERKDWAAGRITSGTRKSVILLWVFVLFWLAASTVITLLVVPPEWQRGNHAALIAVIFPLIGLAVLVFAFNTTRAWRRFGQSFFEMAAMPGALGGTLEGMIRVNTRLRPEHGLHLRLSCLRRSTTGTGNNRSTTEKILWQDEKWLRADLPQTDLNATGIPVYFKLPADQPESTTAVGDGTHWKLEASAHLRGPNYHATFEVPVFNVPETPAPTDDPTAPYQLSLDEIRQQIHSHVQVKDLAAGGREFIFPAGRNPGFAGGATAFLLIWTTVVVFLIWKQAPFIFPLVFSAIDLLMAAFVFDLWFRRSRVVATPAQVQIETTWLGLKKQRTLKVSEVAKITTDVGATAGHTAYYDLKLRTRDGQEFTAAKNLGSKPEADWLAQQLAAAVKNSP